MNVLIIGGGITGPALGVALARAGIGSHLVEARPADRTGEGAFLALAPNGMNALATIGLTGLIHRAGGIPLPEMRFYNPAGRQIGYLDAAGAGAEYGAQTHLIRRRELCEALLSAATEAGVRTTFGRRLTGLRQDGRQVVATFDDGGSITADVVLGADGVHSTVRRLALPGAPAPRYTGVLDCGAWTAIDLPDTGGQRMVWGRRAFFGYTVAAGTAYWFSNVGQEREPARGELDAVDPGEWLARLRELHGDDPAPVPQILAAAEAALGVWAIYDLGDLPDWHAGRVCVLGDAAHAASPSAGQGASLALEDAAVLARCLRDIADPPAAFATFESLRKERAQRIVALGRRIGDRKVPSAGKAWIRDRMLPLFLRMGAKQAAEQYRYRVDWHAPVLPGARDTARGAGAGSRGAGSGSGRGAAGRADR